MPRPNRKTSLQETDIPGIEAEYKVDDLNTEAIRSSRPFSYLWMKESFASRNDASGALFDEHLASSILARRLFTDKPPFIVCIYQRSYKKIDIITDSYFVDSSSAIFALWKDPINRIKGLLKFLFACGISVIFELKLKEK